MFLFLSPRYEEFKEDYIIKSGRNSDKEFGGDFGEDFVEESDKDSVQSYGKNIGKEVYTADIDGDISEESVEDLGEEISDDSVKDFTEDIDEDSVEDLSDYSSNNYNGDPTEEIRNLFIDQP